MCARPARVDGGTSGLAGLLFHCSTVPPSQGYYRGKTRVPHRVERGTKDERRRTEGVCTYRVPTEMCASSLRDRTVFPYLTGWV